MNKFFRYLLTIIISLILSFLITTLIRSSNFVKSIPGYSLTCDNSNQIGGPACYHSLMGIDIDFIIFFVSAIMLGIIINKALFKR